MKTTSFLLALPLAAALFAGCKKDSDAIPLTGSFSIHMDTRVGNNAFALGTPYTKTDGQTFSVTTFKYYVSNVRLIRADGSTFNVPDSYVLVDAARPQSGHLEFNNVTAGDYVGLSFMAGVDETRNTSGAQTGALDPNNGMFWDWNQGYIFTKLEGTSSASPSGAITFHIGGTANTRTVTRSFGTSTLTIRSGHTPSVRMLVEPLAMFESSFASNQINFATTYNVMANHPASGTIADNISRMFLVSSIHNH